MATKIEKKIVGYALKSENDVIAIKEPQADINPLTKRIDKRPAGEFDSKTVKVEYWTLTGKEQAYLTVSFMPVDGVINSENVMVERPIEFFYHNGLDQWISASMRNLSLAARAGFLAEALQDMRNVKWTDGQVKCGVRDHGNGKVVPVYHDSVVAAIAWSIQDILYRKGFVDMDGNQVPVDVLVRKLKNETVSIDDLLRTENSVIESSAYSNVEAIKGRKCPSCHSQSLVNQGGCDLCTECGYSKCS